MRVSRVADAALLFNHTHILVSPSAHLPKKENDFIIIFFLLLFLFLCFHTVVTIQISLHNKKKIHCFMTKKKKLKICICAEKKLLYTRWKERFFFGVCVWNNNYVFFSKVGADDG